MRYMVVLAALGVLAACQQTVDTDLPDQPMPDAEIIVEDALDENGLPLVSEGESLEFREPDTCKSEKLPDVIGQGVDIIPTLGLTEAVRIVQPGDIVSQEYDAYRTNFYLDANGLIVEVKCG